jgi:hypothetical protein
MHRTAAKTAGAISSIALIDCLWILISSQALTTPPPDSRHVEAIHFKGCVVDLFIYLHLTLQPSSFPGTGTGSAGLCHNSVLNANRPNINDIVCCNSTQNELPGQCVDVGAPVRSSIV